tara:strand:- start:5012 stop:6490 length:1479 start_codon:yes stop_codon:yes gene_type:complete
MYKERLLRVTMNLALRLSIAILCSLFTRPLLSFEIFGNKWIGGETTIYSDIPGRSASGMPWDIAFLQAAAEWNEKTDFKFNVVSEYRNPCFADGVNGVAFLSDMCGESFGKSALAVTALRYQSQLLGPAAIIEADIFINANANFDIYAGTSSVQNQSTSKTVDFRRTALHELGHVIGLGHESTHPAIMKPSYGDIDQLQEDDLLGVSSLYGGLKRCSIQSLRLGITSESLSRGDCTVQDLTAGGSDDSFVDVYDFSLKRRTGLNFDVTSNQLESVIIVADNNLRYLTSDSDISVGCNAELSTILQPGNYFLLVNTYTNQVKQECGTEGVYKLIVNYEGQSVQSLGPAISLHGGKSEAQFEGQISADNGKSFASRFGPDDSLEISATITMDPNHVGKSGFLMVVAQIGEEILVLNKERKFLNLTQVKDKIVPFLSKTLEQFEIIKIASGLIPENVMVKNIDVEFFVGYGLVENPIEIYYHQTPLILSVSDKKN